MKVNKTWKLPKLFWPSPRRSSLSERRNRSSCRRVSGSGRERIGPSTIPVSSGHSRRRCWWTSGRPSSSTSRSSPLTAPRWSCKYEGSICKANEPRFNTDRLQGKQLWQCGWVTVPQLTIVGLTPCSKRQFQLISFFVLGLLQTPKLKAPV